jgi:phage tail-like protein
MAAIERPHPYGAFKFLVEFSGEPPVKAGFSDVSGLGMEMNYSEYRSGDSPKNTPIKIPNTYKLDEVTLKRGLIGSTEIYEWCKKVNEGHRLPRNVTIVVQDETGTAALQFVLKDAQPKKWMGPTLAAKGGGEVAMEELHLVHEGIDYE